MKKSEFQQITITGLPNEDNIKELVISEMLNLGFDSFWEDNDLLHGYILSEKFDEEKLKQSIQTLLPNLRFRIIKSELENKNWNEEWESNFQPVNVEDQIYVSAPFHAEINDIPYQVKIIPKMSFGTAHHATTYSMLRLMNELDLSNKTVIDAGTGTGILAIFAEIKGAKNILAYDNDDWSIENSLENIELNKCKKITIKKGEKEVLEGEKCDVLLANIHKNVILSELDSYFKALNVGGKLLLSGFYSEDLADISDSCEKLGLEIEKFIMKDNWVAALFTK